VRALARAAAFLPVISMLNFTRWLAERPLTCFFNFTGSSQRACRWLSPGTTSTDPSGTSHYLS
jgi:hypothetical protein